MKRLNYLMAVTALGITAAETEPPLPKVFGGGEVKEVLWVRLDRNDDVLKSLVAIFEERGIRDGAVLNGT